MLHIELQEELHAELIEHLMDAVRRNETEAAALLTLAEEIPEAKDRARERLDRAGSAETLLSLLAKY